MSLSKNVQQTHMHRMVVGLKQLHFYLKTSFSRHATSWKVKRCINRIFLIITFKERTDGSYHHHHNNVFVNVFCRTPLAARNPESDFKRRKFIGIAARHGMRISFKEQGSSAPTHQILLLIAHASQKLLQADLLYWQSSREKASLGLHKLLHNSCKRQYTHTFGPAFSSPRYTASSSMPHP